MRYLLLFKKNYKIFFDYENDGFQYIHEISSHVESLFLRNSSCGKRKIFEINALRARIIGKDSKCAAYSVRWEKIMRKMYTHGKDHIVHADFWKGYKEAFVPWIEQLLFNTINSNRRFFASCWRKSGMEWSKYLCDRSFAKALASR